MPSLRIFECTRDIVSGFRGVEYPKVMYCDVCQVNHPVSYVYHRVEGEQGFHCIENRRCTIWFYQTNNRTGAELIYTVDEVVANLRRQLENGVEVSYEFIMPH